MAAPPVDAEEKRRARLLRGRAEVDGLAAELDPLARALVDRVVGAQGVGMRLAEPGKAEVVAHLLVGGGGEDQVARRLEAVPRERGDRDRARGDLALHVEGA